MKAEFEAKAFARTLVGSKWIREETAARLSWSGARVLAVALDQAALLGFPYVGAEHLMVAALARPGLTGVVTVDVDAFCDALLLSSSRFVQPCPDQLAHARATRNAAPAAARIPSPIPPMNYSAEARLHDAIALAGGAECGAGHIALAIARAPRGLPHVGAPSHRPYLELLERELAPQSDWHDLASLVLEHGGAT